MKTKTKKTEDDSLSKSLRPISMEEVLEAMELTTDSRIIAATIKDDYCKFSYDLLEGAQKGFKHKVDGTGIIDKDLAKALSKFNVHLSAIDDMFKHAGIDFKKKTIDSFHNHELTQLYEATGFIIKGAAGNENIILLGTKYVTTAGGRIEIKTPEIPLSGAPSYPWYNELKEASDKVREEVQMYRCGKYTVKEEDLIVVTDQPKLFDGGELSVTSEEHGDEFAKAKV